MRARGKFLAPLVHVDLLIAELEGEALLGRRAEGGHLHAEHFGVEADARRLVAGGEDDVVDVVDHGFLGSLPLMASMTSACCAVSSRAFCSSTSSSSSRRLLSRISCSVSSVLRSASMLRRI